MERGACGVSTTYTEISKRSIPSPLKAHPEDDSVTADTNPVSWFEIPARELEPAKAFYETTLDIEMKLFESGAFRMAWFPTSEGASGATGALMESESYVPSYDGSMIYFSVEDIEGVLKRAGQTGGKVIREKMSIGEFGFVGHFEDSEGNRVGLRSAS